MRALFALIRTFRLPQTDLQNQNPLRTRMKHSRDVWLLVLLTIGIVTISVFPFHPLRSASEIRDLFSDFFAYPIEPPIIRTVLERVILLTPLGYFMARIMRGRPLAWHVMILLAGSLTLCLFVELIQYPVEGRHARSSDAMVAIVCVTAGYALATRVYSQSFREIWTITVLAAGFPCLLAAASLVMGPSTINWSSNYPVILGNELDGYRGWEGEISGIAIYPEGLTQGQVAAISKMPFDPAHESDRKRLRALWVYSGEDASGAVTRPLRFPGPTSPPAAAIPDDLGRRLAKRIRASDGLAVEVRVRSGKERQFGPARIVSSSVTSHLRNFMLAQHHSWFVFRVRTLSSGANGDGMALSTPDGSVTGAWQHVVADYDDAVGSIYVDGVRVTGPYAFNRMWRWDHTIFAPTLVIMAALAAGGVLSASILLPSLLRRRP